MTKVIILGFGISGMLAKYVFPEAQVITEASGNIDSHWETIRLHRTFGFDRILRGLDLSQSSSLARVGCEYDGNIYDRPVENFVELLWERRMRGMANQSPTMGKPTLSCEIYDASSYQFVATLHDKIHDTGPRTILQSCESIDLNNRLVRTEDGSVFPYDILISTVPAKTFWRCAGERFEFQSLDLFFSRSRIEPGVWDDKYTWVFYTSKPYDRVNHFGGYYLYESSNPEFVGETRMRGGRFISAYNHEPPGVWFLGRFAECNCDVRIDNVIENLAVRQGAIDKIEGGKNVLHNFDTNERKT